MRVLHTLYAEVSSCSSLLEDAASESLVRSPKRPPYAGALQGTLEPIDLSSPEAELVTARPGSRNRTDPTITSRDDSGTF